MNSIISKAKEEYARQSTNLHIPPALSLLEIEQEYKALIETTNNGYVVLDEKGNVLGANREYLKLTGFNSLEEIIGRNVIEWAARQDRQRNIEARKKCIEQGFIRGLNIQYTKKDGRITPIEVNATVLQDSTGIKILSLLRDLSEHQELENKLRTSEIRYRLLFENMLGGFTHCKLLFENSRPQDFIFIEINSTFEKLTGLKHVVGRKITEIIPNIKELNPELFNIFERVVFSGRPERFEMCWEPSGIWFLISIYSVEQEYFVAVFDDITERKIAEEQLKLKTKNLEEVNTALKVLLEQVEDSRMELKENILSNIRELVLPYLNNLKSSCLSSRQLSFLSVAESNLNTITSSFLPLLKLKYYNLTPREIEVATLVKEGKSIKEIAELLAISTRTVQFHRISLREKLGFKNRKTNLRTHLLSLQ